MSLGCHESAAASDPFTDPANWTAYDAGNTGGMFTRGYFGAAFDGRYVYYAPCRMAAFHGRALRYDTQSPFASPGSWAAYDAGATGGLTTVGYAGAVAANGYVYFVPFSDTTSRHARMLRVNTAGSFTDPGSWSAYDAGPVVGLPYSGYDGAVSDGRFIYFAPFGYEPYAHGRALRFDTEGTFTSAASWTVYDAGQTSGLLTEGYYGAVMDGRHVYFVPFHDGAGFHGRALRYDTLSGFTNPSSWEAYDAGQTDGMTTVGYKGACFDGRYIYFAPFRDGSASHGRVLRYDTQGPFSDPASWTAYDAGATGGLDARGYVGAEHVGHYIYFIPYSYEESEFHAIALRYDTLGGFTDPGSWTAYDAGASSGLTTKGYKYSAFDGRYLYYVPYNNGIMFSGIALRYDTAADLTPTATPALPTATPTPYTLPTRTPTPTSAATPTPRPIPAHTSMGLLALLSALTVPLIHWANRKNQK